MTRRHLTFTCEGATLIGTLDREAASHSTGLLIVSGGNELRSGAWSGQAQLAARIASEGYPVFRYDRRGVGDSQGENRSFRHSGPDIAAALAAFRSAAPHVSRIVAFGNCDAASALLLHQPLALDALILANPWTYEDSVEEADEPALPPASAIRARYLARLKDPKSLLRLLKGEIDIGKLFRGLSALKQAPQPPAPDSLADRLDRIIAELPCPAMILLATGDRTAQAFMDALAPSLASIEANPSTVGIEKLASPSHSFAGKDADWLLARILRGLA